MSSPASRGFALIALLLAAPALATPAADAFAAGRWEEAVSLGRKGTSATDRIAEARALSVLATYQTTDAARARALLEQAVAAADAAVKADPGNPRALLERAIVGGYLAKLNRSAGGAKASRRDTEAVLAKDPGNALATAILGGWHGESVATLGSFLARSTLGAREAESIRLFDKALSLDPRSVLFPTFYAFTLLKLDRGNAGKAEQLLVQADRNRAADAYEALVQAHARQVLGALRRGQAAEASVLARQLSPLGRIG
jgi:tetratricopeptide (TPR) repeat protein